MKTNPSAIARTLVACLFAASANLHAAALFAPNNQPTGWVGEVAVSSFDFANGSQLIFKPDFIKANWSGNLFAFPVKADGTVLFDAEEWSGGAAAQLKTKTYDTRFIVTMRKDGTKIPFRYASLHANQQDALDGNSVKATAIINYIRGDAANEKPLGLAYRKRSGPLGDIIHSGPLFVPDATNPRVYVGANDGMLHAFDAKTGAEVFAYLPSFFIYPVAATSFSHVDALTVDPYVHNYFVDATPTAARVKISGTSKTILVGGVGAGGKGLYALDITDPTAASEAAAASKILWEITPTTVNTATSTAYADLGYTYGVPVIAKLQDGTLAVIVGNGYNNKGSDQAVLYVINLMTGAKIAQITTTSPTAVSDSNANGLSSPTAVDTNQDGKVDYVYAGDINGNLWKFNLTSASSASWSATRLYTTNPAQPITGRPEVSLHPLGGYMINFATGRMFTSADATDTTVYYAWGIRDNGTTIVDSNIVAQTLTTKTWTSGAFNYKVRVSSSNAVDYAAATPKQGWKLALPAGERVVGDGGLVTNQRYHFASTNPTITYEPVGGVLRAQGDNWLNEVDFTTGGGGNGPVFDLDSNFSLGDSDRVKNGTDPQAGPTGVPVSRFISTGVMSQPIVARLTSLSQTYFNANPDLAMPPPTSGDPGVSGGHFDFDIYYGGCTYKSDGIGCSKDTHIHEYDDKYNVTGVNLLAPSSAAHNIVNAIPSLTTQFKILMANQKMSPAVKFLRGGLAGIPVTDYLTTAGLTMASLPTYTRGADTLDSTADITSLIWALPLDAFASKEWVAGSGDVRAGVVPTVTGCVRGNDGGGTAQTGPIMNGALVIQLVKATTPDSAVELNQAGTPSMGWRLKKDVTSQTNLLAQWTIFWHHPNGKCINDAGWVKNPPQDPDGSSASASSGAPGSDDPKDGLFGSGGTLPTGGPTGGTVAGPSSTATYTMADGTIVTVTMVSNPDGSVTVTVTSPAGTYSFNPPGKGGNEADGRFKTGRVSWREMIRP